MSIAASLHKAAKLQEKIEGLRKQLSDLLNKARQEFAATPVRAVPAVLRAVSGRGRQAAKTAKPKAIKVTPKKASRPAKQKAVEEPAAPAVRGRKSKGPGRPAQIRRKRASSPGGPLAPAVVKVLQGNGKPMRVAEILDGLSKNGYEFSAPDPKKNLAARIYRLSGVKQVSQGLFTQV